MILARLWKMIKIQLNKWVSRLRGKDPIAEMQYECDLAAEQLKEGRKGLEQYRGLVERVKRQVWNNKAQTDDLEAQIRSYLAKGDRETAGVLALQLERAEKQQVENEEQLKMHEQAYDNNLLKLKNANKKILDVRQRVATYDATLKMSRAEAEISKVAHSLNFDVTTDFGQVESLIQERIDQNRAEVRVAADLSSHDLDRIKHEEDVEKQQAEKALLRFEPRLLEKLERKES